jgi:thiol-disulfide isomerase/thioredoxin
MMSVGATLSRHRVLICGILSPVAAIVFYALVYGTLTSLSSNVGKDWQFRLSISTLALIMPFLITVLLAWKDRRKSRLTGSAIAGLIFAALSLGLALQPIKDGILRSRQTRNMAMHDVPAPPFDTVDLLGNSQRLSDQTGKVVLINIWATWCVPCRKEMPELDRLYRERKDQGLVVYGLSNQDVDVQQMFLRKVPVSYPLLTLHGNIPSLYRDIAQYPAIFLIDRSGNLQPAPPPGQPFDQLVATVDALLHRGS